MVYHAGFLDLFALGSARYQTCSDSKRLLLVMFFEAEKKASLASAL